MSSADGNKQVSNALNLSLTEGGNEGNSKVVAPNKYLESKLCGVCVEQGIGISDRVEYLGINIRIQTKKAGKKDM